jgi:hypothetical protein
MRHATSDWGTLWFEREHTSGVSVLRGGGLNPPAEAQFSHSADKQLWAFLYPLSHTPTPSWLSMNCKSSSLGPGGGRAAAGVGGAGCAKRLKGAALLNA